MATIGGLAAAKAILGDFVESRFSDLVSLRYDALQTGGSFDATIELVLRDPGSDRRVHWRFEGVRGLTVQRLLGVPPQVVGFSVNDVSSRGWEGTNWEVRDFENGVIGFTSRTAQVVAVARAGEDLTLCY